MSFEGSIEFIAKDGSYWVCDVYDEPAKPLSPYTESPAEWWHLIDMTNGIVDDDANTFPAPKKRVGRIDIWREDHYGNRYAVPIDLFEPVPSDLWKPIIRT